MSTAERRSGPRNAGPEGWLEIWVQSPTNRANAVLFVSPASLHLLRRRVFWVGLFCWAFLGLLLWIFHSVFGKLISRQVVSAMSIAATGWISPGICVHLEIDLQTAVLRRSFGFLGWRWWTREENPGQLTRVRLDQVDPEKRIFGSYSYRLTLVGAQAEAVVSKGVRGYDRARWSAEEFAGGLGIPIDDPASLGESIEAPGPLHEGSELRVVSNGSSASVCFPGMLLTVDREAILLDRSLFGFRRRTRIPCAEVIDVFLEPHRRGSIVIRTKDRFLSFGKRLPAADKQWLARFLRFVPKYSSGQLSSNAVLLPP